MCFFPPPHVHLLALFIEINCSAAPSRLYKEYPHVAESQELGHQQCASGLLTGEPHGCRGRISLTCSMHCHRNAWCVTAMQALCKTRLELRLFSSLSPTLGLGSARGQCRL